MEYLERRFQINENRVLIYRVSEGYAKPTFNITEGIMEGNKLLKTYDLSQWDDYGFNGWVNDEETEEDKKVSFEFDMNHPLFLPLIHLLNYDDELIIDDDDTREDNKKYLLLHREKDKMYLDFINELEHENKVGERYYIFIKNILFDGRSKIDQNQKDTKERLACFFNEVHNILTKDSHQISIEEWLLRNNMAEECKPLRRVYRKDN